MDDKNKKHTPEEISGRMKLMAGIFQKDAQISDLHNEKIALLQQFYDLEMKMYGRMSKIGSEILEVQHCEVFHGRIREMTEAERKEASVSNIGSQQTDRSNSVHGKLDLYKQKTQQTDARQKEEGQKRDVPER